MTTGMEILRLTGVIACICVAAALATPPGRLPLALRGLRKIMRRDAGMNEADASEKKASAFRRTIAFTLVLLAVALAMI